MLIFRWVVSVMVAAALGSSLVAPIPSQAAAVPAKPTPAILTVWVDTGTEGAETAHIHGHAPPYSNVTLEVLDLVSADLPTLSVATVQVSADGRGAFATSVPLVPDFPRGSRVVVKASLDVGTATAISSTIIAAPNVGNPISAWDGKQ